MFRMFLNNCSFKMAKGTLGRVSCEAVGLAIMLKSCLKDFAAVYFTFFFSLCMGIWNIKFKKPEIAKFAAEGLSFI
jgi:hypothetical protein